MIHTPNGSSLPCVRAEYVLFIKSTLQRTVGSPRRPPTVNSRDFICKVTSYVSVIVEKTGAWEKEASALHWTVELKR